MKDEERLAGLQKMLDSHAAVFDSNTDGDEEYFLTKMDFLVEAMIFKNVFQEGLDVATRFGIEMAVAETRAKLAAVSNALTYPDQNPIKQAKSILQVRAYFKLLDKLT
jgi:hypothetical protein